MRNGILHFAVDNEKTQYFVIGYYGAIHAGQRRWIWKKSKIRP